MNKLKLLGISLAVLLLNLPLALAVSSVYFEYTQVYFNIPRDALFQIALLSGGTYTWSGSPTAITEGGATATSPVWVSFNMTTVPAIERQPQTVGVASDIQSGILKPIWKFKNTGNCNEYYSIKMNSTLGTDLAIGFNETCDTGTCGTENNALGVYKNMTQNAVYVVANNMALNAIINITLWGSASAASPAGESGGYFIIHNSTCV